MTLLARVLERSHNKILRWSNVQTRTFSSQNKPEPTTSSSSSTDDEEFRVLNLRQFQASQTRQRPKQKKDILPPPRSTKMPIDQDWGNVWPGIRTFHPATVPLPLRQGYTDKGKAPPSKYANAELMKIPNFLHLTPPVIKRQCEALKRFCTPWPKGLENEEKWEKYFPIEVITSDYCHGLPTIRNPLARIVTIRFKLSNLKFDKHSKDKFLRLVGERHNPETDVLTIVTDRCPLRKQNYDYAQYIITALYHESWITEPWEETKSEADMEYYDFNRNKSKISAEDILNWKKNENDAKIEATKTYAKSVENLMNDGENEYNMQKYKEQVLKLYGFDVENITKEKAINQT